MKYTSQAKQLTIDDFKSSWEGLSKSNRWVQLGDSLPWAKIEKLYNSRLNNSKKGAGNKPARMIIGAIIIQRKLALSDIETIQMIQENPYMQYMLGLPEFTDKPIFDPSLFVTIRKRIGEDVFNDMSVSLLERQIQLQGNPRRRRMNRSPKKKVKTIISLRSHRSIPTHAMISAANSPTAIQDSTREF